MSGVKKKLDLIFPEELVKEPLIHDVSIKYGIVFNIRRAKVTETVGELLIEFEGKKDEVEKAITYLKRKGVKVEPLTHDIVE